MILGGTNPAEWHFDLAPGTELAAVLLSGRYPGTQKIVNLPPGVPALNYSGLSCVYFSFLPGDFDKINSVSQTLFGRLPERGFQAVDGKLIIDPSWPIRAAAPVYLTPAPKIRPNQDLELALAEGLIRPASAELRAAWYKKHAEKAGWANLMDPADYNYEPSFPVYEILSESFAFSANMVNSDQLGFILPENMRLPEGAPGRSIIHIMDDGACWGSGRGCQSYSN